MFISYLVFHIDMFKESSKGYNQFGEAYVHRLMSWTGVSPTTNPCNTQGSVNHMTLKAKLKVEVYESKRLKRI